MSIDTSTAVSIIAAVVAFLSWLEARQMSKLTSFALRQQSYENVESLPSIEALGVVDVGNKRRAKLIVFNQRATPFLVNCVKLYRYEPKERSPLNWFRSMLGPFDWDYTYERAFWNPKGSLDDEERYAEEALPFILVKETEILLVTLTQPITFPSQRYKFEVMTSRGTSIWEGALPNGATSFPYEHRRTIT